jgi:hypothetical protein
MKYFFDTEFIERPYTIDLISIGIVSENGKEFYALNRECNLDMASPWVIENVLKPMPQYNPVTNYWKNSFDKYLLTKKEIANEILSFIDNSPEFWAYYCSYDWVVFCWLYGAMIDLPKGWPMYCRDLKQEMDRLKIENIPIDNSNNHNALDDARWVKKSYEFIVNL